MSNYWKEPEDVGVNVFALTRECVKRLARIGKSHYFYRMNIIYLHGFNSAYDPTSAKVQALKLIGEVGGVTYNSFATYEQIFSEISPQIPHKTELLVGTSLGGFWAAEIGKHLGLPAVIINPAINPAESLRKYVGKSLTNYVSGETTVLLQSVPGSYLTGITSNTAYLPLVLLDLGDEILDAFAIRKALHGFPMACWDGGSHRFDHMDEAIKEIESYTNHCSLMGLTKC